MAFRRRGYPGKEHAHNIVSADPASTNPDLFNRGEIGQTSALNGARRPLATAEK
ncbi:hypothetical protein IF1G_00811 [Cordyceps javanica]|uniref:Uncharacterized protein n=1 Tax=Cordyceps javanica TaxID=43265 RepID=A0A545VGX0_9HYPO|nr:hypothetical protein IF1G_00811 [Cordyceps javanica]